MAYKIDSAWERGQTITAERLNHMEKGIASALNAIGKAFGKEYDDDSNEEYTVGLENLGSKKSIAAGAITGTTLKATDTESESALDIAGASVLKGNVTIGTTDTAVDTTINGKLIVNGKYDDSSPAVLEAATLTGKVNISGDTVVNGNIIVGDTTTNNSIKNKIYGTTTLFGKLEVQSKGSLTVNGNSFINSNFYHQVNQAHENDGSLTWFPDSVFYAYYKTIILGAKGEMISPDQPGERIISEDNSSTISLSGRLLTISNTTTNIQSAYTNIKGYVTIGSEPTNNIYAGTLIVNANSTLRGTTTIDKLAQLIVGDVNTISNIENKIYGTTAIYGTTSIYGTTTIYDTLQIGTYGTQDFWPNPEEPRIEQFGVQGTLNIFSNIQIGLTGDEEGRGTKQLVNTNTRIHGNTTIDNLTVNALTLNTGIHINQYASGTDSYGLIVEKNTLLNDMVVFVNNSTQKGFKFQVQETTPSTNLIIEPYSIGNKDSTLQFKNSNLILTSEKVLKINETSLSEDDIKHLHTLWTNYETQNGGETS